MRHITDTMIDAAIGPLDAQQVLLDAFQRFGRGEAAMQERIRTEAGGVKLSTLGAVIPGQDVVGAKVYTTIAGQFQFVILLFSATDGRALASFDAAAITRLRTAACSVIASRHLAGPAPRKLALLGAGEQGRAHAEQFAAAYALDEIAVAEPYPAPDLVEKLQRRCGVAVRLVEVGTAVDGADLIVTASRSAVPLFAGDRVAPGAFVAAIGSSLPHTRELDDRLLARAASVTVEWLPQSTREAGDLVLAAPGLLDGKLVELGALVTGAAPGRRHADEIHVYKSVGVGLEDVALAGLAWQRLNA